MEERKTLISIIVAVYNGEKTIGAALESIKRQRYKYWECLIIDGDSKDNTLHIANQFALEDKRFKVFSEPDQGVFDAFNKGWKRAKGEWIYYLGADDELLEDGLLSLANGIDETCDIVYGGIVKKYKSGRMKVGLAGNWTEAMPYHLPCSHQAMIMKKELIKSLGGFDLKYSLLADYDLINHAFHKGISTKRIDEPVAIFSLGGMSTDNIKSLRQRFLILRKYHAPYIHTLRHIVYMMFFFALLKIKHRFS